MAQTNAILAAIQRIHEAPLTADGWERALPSIAAVTRSDVALLLVQDVRSGADEYAAGFGLAPEHVAGFVLAARTGKIPGWAQAMPVGTVVQSSSAMSDSEFMRSEFYNEAIRPMGTFHGLAAKPLGTPRRRVFVTPGRRLGTEDYSTSDVAAMQLLVPHIVTALHLGRRLASAEMRGSVACAALEHLDTAIFLVGEEGRIIYSNRIADALLARSHRIGTAEGCIRLRDDELNRVMLRMIGECADVVRCARRPKHMIGIPRENGRPNLRMIVAPFPPDDIELGVPALGSRPAAIVMISDPEQEIGNRKAWLRREFDLTAAEADVAVEIAKGDGRDAAAARLGITMATVRTHLLHIFEKTGVRRQAEFVRLLLEG
ncbi:helix-turn-helix transcriptional regulator [Microvirga sp. M2]|uniref:helix-turn-helix transcriptional regulator n=1 Tax=Microvirga sp. M2 TaxID=3073270 RepID=UPI0039C3662A